MKMNCPVIQIVIMLSLLAGGMCPDSRASAREKDETRDADRKMNFDRRGPAGSFLIRTVDGEGLDDRLKDSAETISHPFGNVVTAAGTLAAGERKPGASIPLGTVYRLEGNCLEEPLDLGTVSVLLGEAPVEFEPAEHVWSGAVMCSEFVSRKTSMVDGLKLVREICVDRQGSVFVSLRLTGRNQEGRELLKTRDFRYRVEGVHSRSSAWRVWNRQPDGTLLRPGQAGRRVECGVIGEGDLRTAKDFFIAIQWGEPASKSPGVISAAEVELEGRIGKSRPIGSIKSATTRWIGKTFPAWDCPEPWLNKLWAGQVVSICNQLMTDPAEDGLVFRADSPEYLRCIFDARWMRDASIGWRTLHAAGERRQVAPPEACVMLGPAGEAMLRCRPHGDLQAEIFRRASAEAVRLEKDFSRGSSAEVFSWMNDAERGRYLLANYQVLEAWSESTGRQQGYRKKAEDLARRLKLAGGGEVRSARELLRPDQAITDYAGLMRWCRSFYTNEDFRWLIDVRLSGDGRRVETRVPAGVLDVVVTRVVGLHADGTDRVTIRPAAWIGHWPYFAIDNLPYRGHNLTVAWQSPDHPRRYRELDAGLTVFVDGKVMKQTGRLEPVEIELK